MKTKPVPGRNQAFRFTSSRMLTYKGKTRPLPYWATKQKIKNITLSTRLKRGWTTKMAIETPTQTKNRQ
jgi:hypothetical protein